MYGEHDQGGGKIGSFILGFAFGVIVCLAGGSAMYLLQGGRLASIEAAADEAAYADEARRTEAETREAAERAAREAKEAERPSN